MMYLYIVAIMVVLSAAYWAYKRIEWNRKDNALDKIFLNLFYQTDEEAREWDYGVLVNVVDEFYPIGSEMRDKILKDYNCFLFIVEVYEISGLGCPDEVCIIALENIVKSNSLVE